MRTLTLIVFVLLSQGCMKQAISSMLGGAEWHDGPDKTQACSQSVRDAYADAKTRNTDPTLERQFEITFNCTMGDSQ